MKQSIKVLLVCLLLATTFFFGISLQKYLPQDSFFTIASASSELNTHNLYITKGEAFQLKVKGTKSKVKWYTDDASIATVNKKGKVTAKKKGDTVITAEIDTGWLFCYVTVETPKISKKNITLIKGAEYELEMKGTEQNVKWTTSDKSIAKVSKYGTVYAKKAGTATVTATVGKKNYKCEVKVEAPKLSKRVLFLEPEKQFKLSLSGTTKKVKWYSSNSAVAAVSQSGTVTAKKLGCIYITAKVGGVSYECETTVEKPYLSETQLLLSEGDTHYLFVYDTYQDENWTSSNSDVVEVDDTGIVDAKRTGTAIIHCDLGYKTLDCTVTVENPALSQTELSIVEGETAKLSLNGTKQKAKWSSSNTSIVTVSDDGLVSAIKEGFAYIYAELGTKRYTCDVTVKDAPVDMSQIQASYYDTGRGIVGVFKNSYKEAVSIEMTVLYYDSTGKLIDQRSEKENALATGKEAAIKVINPYDGNTWDDLEYSNYNVILNVKKSSYEDLANDFIALEPSDTGNKIIVKATNNSDKDLSSVEVAIVYFDATGRCIGYESTHPNCNDAHSSDYINFDYPYDRTNYSTITPASYKIYINHAYKYSWE